MRATTAGGFLERPGQWIAVGVLLAAASGCATNHTFDRGVALDVPGLVSELEAQSEEERALFDLTYIPFVHLDLQAFAENDDTAHYPEGYAFVSVRSWLPLLGVVDVDIELYDTAPSAYERNEFTSILWGLWTGRRTTVDTRHGQRTESNANLLWIFDLEPRVHYDPLGQR